MFNIVSKLRFIALFSLLFIMSACSDSDDFNPYVVTDVQVVSDKTTFPANDSQLLEATAIYSGGTTTDASSHNSIWTSNDESIAIVNAEGVVKGVSHGTTLINANYNGVIGSISITITEVLLVTIEVQPPVKNIPLGLHMKYQAVGIYSDNSKHILDHDSDIHWDSSDVSVATIDNETAIAKTLKVGETIITVAFQGIEGNATLYVTDEALVSLTISPVSDTSIPAGYPLSFTAEARYTDDSNIDVTDDVEWHTTEYTFLNTTDDQGTFLAIAPGNSDVTATLGLKTSNVIPVTVTHGILESVVIEAPKTSYANGYGDNLIANGSFSGDSQEDIAEADNVHWTSTDTSVGTISSDGYFKATGEGVTTITLNTDEGFSDTEDFTVTPAVPTGIHVVKPIDLFISPGENRQYFVRQLMSDDTEEVIDSPLVSWYLNDGIDANYNDSAYIDASGVVHNQLDSGEVGTLKLSVQAYINGISNQDETFSYIGAVKTLQTDNEETDEHLSFVGSLTYEDSRLVGMKYSVYTGYIEDGVSGPSGVKFSRLSHTLAENACKDLVYNKHVDYRLPTYDELAALWDKYAENSGIPYALYTEQNWSVGVPFWTSTPGEDTAEGDKTFQIFDLGTGIDKLPAVNTPYYVSCVRNNDFLE